jgi:hypothetical protein
MSTNTNQEKQVSFIGVKETLKMPGIDLRTVLLLIFVTISSNFAESLLQCAVPRFSVTETTESIKLSDEDVDVDISSVPFMASYGYFSGKL